MLANPPTYPAAGVIATRAATTPEQAPKVVGLPSLIFSIRIHPIIPAAAATNVLSKAWTACPLAAPAEPALKPNQPNHNIPVPNMTSGRLCGGEESDGQPFRLPRTSIKASDAAPALI